MHIGIIGAGNIGATLARKLSAQGHTIKLANSRAPESISNLARELGVTATNKTNATRDVDVIILAVPFSAHPELGHVLRDVSTKIVIIDTSNYFPLRDGLITEVENGKPESVWASEQLGRPIVKAWNAMLAYTLDQRGTEKGAHRRIAVPVAGDDDHAKKITIDLVEQTGFDGLDAGSLSMSWTQEPGTPAWCTELSLSDLGLAIASADKDRQPRIREILSQELMSRGATLTHDETVALNRHISTQDSVFGATVR